MSLNESQPELHSEAMSKSAANCRRPAKRAREPTSIPATPFVKDVEKGTHKISVGGDWKRPSRSIPLGPEGYVELPNGGRIGYFPQFLSDGDSIFTELVSEVQWEQKEIRLFGNTLLQPRLIAYMARDPSLSYTYSNSTLLPLEYIPAVSLIQAQVEETLCTTFNCVLLNYYRDGGDHMGWHSDNEPLFGPDPLIASISLGTQRTFDFKSNSNPQIRWRCPVPSWIPQKRPVCRYLLGKGDLLVMAGGAVQKEWKHAILPSKSIQGSRINLTFRHITQPEQCHKKQFSQKFKHDIPLC